MLDKVKLALRRSSPAFDVEIEGLIAAALAELRRVGVKVENVGGPTSPTYDPLIERAVILYCKAHFGYGEKDDAERFNRAFQHLLTSLILSGGYHEK